MKNKELGVLRIAGEKFATSDMVQKIFDSNEMFKSINYTEYSKNFNSSSYILTKDEIQEFCQNIKQILKEQNLSITTNTFIDLCFHGNIINEKHIIGIDENTICNTEDLVCSLNETFGAKKFNLYSCHGGEASQDIIETTHDSRHINLSAGISISSHVEPKQPSWTYQDDDAHIHSLQNITKLSKENPNSELSAIVRFAQDLLHDHEMSYYTEITPAYQGHTQHIQYKSSNLFTIKNIENWVNEAKENTGFNFKTVIENYLTNEKEKLIEAFKDGYPKNNSLEKTDTLNALEALKDTALTHHEYQHFVLGRLVYRASVTDEQEVSEYKELFTDFIKLLDNQAIDFKADLNHTPEDGITPADSFFGRISNNAGKSLFSDLLKSYLANKEDEKDMKLMRTIIHPYTPHCIQKIFILLMKSLMKTMCV